VSHLFVQFDVSLFEFSECRLWTAAYCACWCILVWWWNGGFLMWGRETFS